MGEMQTILVEDTQQFFNTAMVPQVQQMTQVGPGREARGQTAGCSVVSGLACTHLGPMMERTTAAGAQLLHTTGCAIFSALPASPPPFIRCPTACPPPPRGADAGRDDPRGRPDLGHGRAGAGAGGGGAGAHACAHPGLLLTDVCSLQHDAARQLAGLWVHRNNGAHELPMRSGWGSAHACSLAARGGGHACMPRGS